MSYAQQVASNLSDHAVTVAYVQLTYEPSQSFFNWLRSTLNDYGTLEFISVVAYRYCILERRN